MIKKRKITSILVDRANYGRLKPVLLALNECVKIDLSIVASGSMVLKRFDRSVEIVKNDGLPVVSEIFCELEGSMPLTMAKSLGLGVIEFSSEFIKLKPDIVLLIGDRYEALAACIAAAFMNITIVHIQGGEVSGSIDESIRHAITKFAHYHVPATEKARENIIRMGEREETILTVGCPASDIVRATKFKISNSTVNSKGSGNMVDVNSPYILAAFHAVTTHYTNSADEIYEFLNALQKVSIQTILLWPNIDAGSNEIGKSIRHFKDQTNCDWLRVVTNYDPEVYLALLRKASCAVGNSSSFVRDSSLLGTPVVLVGDRQASREKSENVLTSICEKNEIATKIYCQLKHGRYLPSSLYGDGFVSERIVEKITEVQLYSQKSLEFS